MDDGSTATTINKSYIIYDIKKSIDSEDCVVIFDDSHKEHLFSLDTKSHSYYEQWFYSVSRIIRERKIKKLNEISNYYD